MNNAPNGIRPALPNIFNEGRPYGNFIIQFSGKDPWTGATMNFGNTNPNGKSANLPNFFNDKKYYEDYLKSSPSLLDGPHTLPRANPNEKVPNLRSYGGDGNYWNASNGGYEVWYNNGGRNSIFDKTYPYKIGSTTIEKDDYTGATAFKRPRMAVPFPRPKKLFTGLIPQDFTDAKIHVIGMSADGKETLYSSENEKPIGANTFVINSKASGRFIEGEIEKLEAKGLIKIQKSGFAQGVSDISFLRNSGVDKNSNYQQADEATRTGLILGLNSTAMLGSPRAFQLGVSGIVAGEVNAKDRYSTVPFHRLRRNDFEVYTDFRSKKANDEGQALGKRLDGASAAARSITEPGGSGGILAGLYAAGAASPVGSYGVINLEATYGFGEHDTPWALRNDFSTKSVGAAVWDKNANGQKLFGRKLNGAWVKAKGLAYTPQNVTPFRGDKVSVIDYKKTSRKKIYKWMPESADNLVQSILEKYGDGLGAVLDKAAGRITKDFVKFYFTGQNMHAGSNAVDDVMVFRAIITSLTDSFNPSWTPVNFIGRADPSYNYGGYSRDINLDFTVYATDRDELKPIWRKLNALAGYTAPTYDGSSIALKGNYLRLTVGDLFHHQPIIINSLYYTLQDSETTWETNVLEEYDMMEVPKQINVSLGATMITDMIPQKDGRFYSLTNIGKYPEGDTEPTEGNHNWLSGFKTNKDFAELETTSINGAPENLVS